MPNPLIKDNTPKRFSKFQPINIKWSKGVDCSKDPALIDSEAITEGVNVVLDDKGVLSRVGGRQKYNSTEVGSSTAIRGVVTFMAEDGVEYEIITCNSKLYWTNGNGTYTAVKFSAENVDITINPSYFHRFVVFDRNIGGTQKKIAYCVTNNYPVATNAAGTENKYTTISRAIRLEVASSVVIGKSVYRDDDGSRTAGADDVEVGASAAEVGWPSKAKYVGRIFDRVIACNYQDDSGNTMKNGWICSEAQDSEDWTNSSVAANSGGGKYPDEFTGLQVLGTSVLMFTRRGILNLACTPSAISNWREYWLNTTLGAINQEAICLHTDGWVYFCSEQGVARTDGRIAERVDYDIENEIQALSQLKNNARSKILNSTADWNAGTPASGGVFLNTASGELKQKALAYSKLNFDFELGDYCWAKTSQGAGSASISDTGGKTAAKCGECSSGLLYSEPTFSGSYKVYNTAGTLLTSGSLSVQSAWTQVSIDLSAYQWQTLYIQVQGGATNDWGALTSNVFTVYGADTLTFYYKASKTYSPGPAAWTCLLIVDDFAGLTSYFSEGSGTVTTNTYDFGVTPTTLGSLTLNATIPAEGSLKVYAETLATDTGWALTDLIATFTTTGVNTVSLATLTVRRYLRFKFEFVGGSYFSVSGCVTGSQWISAIQDLGLIPAAWGVFDAGETKIGETLTYEMNTSANSDMSAPDGYTAVTPGAVPTNTKRRYVQYRVTFNTVTANIPSLQDMTLNYYTSTSQELPAFFSYKDRLYMSFMENGQTTNNITWIGQTKSIAEIKYNISNVSGRPFPMFTKCDFIGAPVFTLYLSTLQHASPTAGFMWNMESGNDNGGSAFTSYFSTKALSFADAQGIWRFLYVYAKSDAAWNIYYRKRNASAVWGAWSTAKVIPLSESMARKVKWVLPGLNVSDFVQFKLEQTVTDVNWQAQGLALYASSKLPGR